MGCAKLPTVPHDLPASSAPHGSPASPTPSAVDLDFWFDLSCPYAYLASQRLAPTLAGRDVRLRYRPMLLGGVFRAIGAGEGPMPGLAPAKRDHLRRDLARWADLAGVPLHTPPAHPMRTVRALRTLLGLPEEQWPAAVHELFLAYWQRGDDLTGDAAIGAALERAGLDEAVIREALAAADSQDRKDDLRTRTDEAVALGIFGAPAFVVHGAGGPRLLWGQDRMMWVEAMLEGWQPPAAAAPALVTAATQRLATPLRPAASAQALGAIGSTPEGAAGSAMAGAPTLDFYFDAASPYSYLGLTQLERVARGHTLRLRPILLGGLFRAIGTADVPLFAFPEAKRRYLMSELSLWAAWWSEPLRFPKKFPQKTTTVQRLLLGMADEPARQLRLALAFSRAMWAAGRDLEDEAVLAEILAGELGEAAAIRALEKTKESAAKAALIEATSAAADAGVFGVPTCIVHDGGRPRCFWGQDRLGLVSAALGGWRAGHEDDPIAMPPLPKSSAAGETTAG